MPTLICFDRQVSFIKVQSLGFMGKKLRIGYLSSSWVCFYELPFSIGLSFPFPVTQLLYAQFMLVVYPILFWMHHFNETDGLRLGLSEIVSVYKLQSFGYSRLVLKVKIGSPHLVSKRSPTDHD